MLIRILWVFFVAQASVACMHVKSDQKEAVPNAIGLTQDEKATIKEKLVEPKSISPELLYSLLGGEIASQRGYAAMASEFYVNAAKRSKDTGVALRAAQIALYNNDIAAAKSAVDILLEDESLSVQARRLALTVYLKSSDVDKSLAQIQKLLQASEIPKRNALLSIGDVVSRHAHSAIAIKIMDVLVVENVNEAGVYLARSKIVSSAGVFEQAEADARRTISLDAAWQAGYIQLAQVLEKKGDTKAALVVLEGSSEELDVRQLSMAYGQLLAKDGQYSEAKKQFLALANKEPSYSAARFALGLMYLRLEDVVRAKETFERLYKGNVFKSKGAFYLGRIERHQENPEEALGWFKKVERGDSYLDAQVAIAMIHAEAKDFKSATSVVRRLRNESPRYVARFYLLEAELLMGNHQYSDVYALLTEAVNETPHDLSLRYARSIAATEVDELAEAEKDLLFVLDKQPTNANALNALGYTLASKTSRFKEARQYLTKALFLRPEDSMILDSMGWLNYREGQYEEALVLLEKAYKKMPEGEIAAHLGETLWVLGRRSEAKVIWQDALQRDVDNRYLIDVIDRLK
ncbi:MAG: hypothetical protein A6F72_07740 [Cycloclasticus sp. symbiont of Poecilosclerida sp. N]|nr:MAG: hypothetical protein A6F72_07740 [Cycloclasticus sp. symbiont of Poecilosclerida sp. N]